MTREIVAVIPVKGNSERVAKKNVRPFHDTTLLELKLNQLKPVTGFKRLVVSSEDENVLSVAQQAGFDTHARDPKYSTSSVPMSEVYAYIASEMEEEYIAWVNVTNPLADSDVYTRAIRAHDEMNPSHDCLLSASEIQEYLYYKGKPVNFKPYPWPRSQDLKGVFALSFVINILKREDMIRWGSCVGDNPYLFILDRVTSSDVDFQEDFDFCEMVYANRNSIGKV